MNLGNEHVEVRKSGIHNNGVFARKDIKKGTKIIEYVGEKITKEESDRRADLAMEEARKDSSKGQVYIFELDDEYDIDGDVSYNSARLINHSCSPNCETDNVDGHIWIIALNDIKEGEELSYDYGYDIEDFWDHPCCCGSDDCVGYIVDSDQWPELFERLSNPEKYLEFEYEEE